MILRWVSRRYLNCVSTLLSHYAQTQSQEGIAVAYYCEVSRHQNMLRQSWSLASGKMITTLCEICTSDYMWCNQMRFKRSIGARWQRPYCEDSASRQEFLICIFTVWGVFVRRKGCVVRADPHYTMQIIPFCVCSPLDCPGTERCNSGVLHNNMQCIQGWNPAPFASFSRLGYCGTVEEWFL